MNKKGLAIALAIMLIGTSFIAVAQSQTEPSPKQDPELEEIKRELEQIITEQGWIQAEIKEILDSEKAAKAKAEKIISTAQTLAEGASILHENQLIAEATWVQHLLIMEEPPPLDVDIKSLWSPSVELAGFESRTGAELNRLKGKATGVLGQLGGMSEEREQNREHLEQIVDWQENTLDRLNDLHARLNALPSIPDVIDLINRIVEIVRIIQDIIDEVETVISDIEDFVEDVNDVVDAVKEFVEEVKSVYEDIKELIDELKELKKTIKKHFWKPWWWDDIYEEAKKIADKFPPIIAEIMKIIEKAKIIGSDVGNLSEDLQDIIDELGKVVDKFDRIISG